MNKDSCSKWFLICFKNSLFPHPGGPHNKIETGLEESKALTISFFITEATKHRMIEYNVRTFFSNAGDSVDGADAADTFFQYIVISWNKAIKASQYDKKVK